MNKKRIVATILSVAMVATLFAGCTKKEAGQTPSTAKKVKIGLTTDEGGLNDKSFNQSANEGIKKAQSEFGVDYKALESTKKEDYQSNLEALVNANCDLSFAVGFQMESAMKAIAAKYPDKKFAIIDSVVDSKNVSSITFKEQEGSFLMGLIAGKSTTSNKVGFIGGKDFELINRFEAGYAAGVKAVNPAAAENLINRKYVKYADSFADVNKGYELANALINEGCDVIYHAAGGVGEGMFKAIKEANDKGKKVWAIGVDKDQAATLPTYAPYILSSMMKRVDTATYTAVKDVAKNTFEGGKTVSLGLKEEGVGYAPTTSKNTKAEVITLVDKYADAVKKGTIVVPTKHTDVAAFQPAKVE